MLKKALTILLLAGAATTAQAQTLVEKTRVLFHAGSRAVLEQDIRANTVPQDAWDRFIMGGQTGFDLPEFRRGLYGAESVYGTGLYATYSVLAGKEPWVMIIQVREECLNEQKLFHANYSVTFTPEKSKQGSFSEWFWAHSSGLSAIAPYCLSQEIPGYPRDWKEGVSYSLSDADAESLKETKVCTPVLNKFLNDQQYKVVRDVVNDDSWYLRDRSCIQSISGTPDQIFMAIADNKIGNPEELLSKNLLGDPVDPSQSSSGTTYVVLKMLTETSYLDATHLPDLKRVSQNFADVSLADIRKDAEEISFANSADSEAFIVAAYDKATRAIQNHTQKSFQTNLNSLLTEFLRQAGASCKGKHGVLAENRKACRETTDLQGQKILKFLLSH